MTTSLRNMPSSKVLTEVPISKHDLILSKTPQCPYCARDLDEFRVVLFGNEKIVGYGPCDCERNKIESKKINEGEETRKSYPTYAIPVRYQGATGGADYAEQVLSGRWLFIYGEVGVGKTYLACAILKHLAKHGHVEFVSSVETTRGFDQDNYKKVSFLVVDDIGKETSSEWAVSQIWDIINYRYTNCKPTIFTSQYTLEQIPERIERNGDYETALSIVSRLYEMCDTVFLKGVDRRIGA